jgi:hypothetical protein
VQQKEFYYRSKEQHKKCKYKELITTHASEIESMTKLVDSNPQPPLNFHFPQASMLRRKDIGAALHYHHRQTPRNTTQLDTLISGILDI